VSVAPQSQTNLNRDVLVAGLAGLGDGATRGTSWGVQLETWF